MSFTNVDDVRLMLIGPSGSGRNNCDERNRFDENNQIILAFLPVEPDTVAVKGIHRNALYGSSVMMEGREWITLPNSQIVPDTLAVTDGNRLAVFYVEGLDYLIDYALGKIKRLSSGSIADSQVVSLYYQAYDLFAINDDYTVDYSTGIITRQSGGAILNEETVWVDYTIAESGAADALLEAAIADAHAQIVVRLAPPYTEDSSDALLAVGETQLACAIAARSLASKPLAMSRDASGDDRALAWLKLADSFEQSAWKTLQPFIVQPRRKSGYAVKNARV